MNETTRLSCELCGTEMSSEMPGESVRYFHCATCGRWVASNYGDELVRAHTAREGVAQPAAETADLGRIKARLASWLGALDERDPYFVLGVSPSASEERVRERFHQLALEHHPDRGGDAAQMRRLIVAFDQIRDGKRAPATPTTVKVAAPHCAPFKAARGRRHG